jgi:uncharacterized protein (TIGR02996 family)
MAAKSKKSPVTKNRFHDFKSEIGANFPISTSRSIPREFTGMQPDDTLAWLAMADWYEENQIDSLAEMIRLIQENRWLIKDENIDSRSILVDVELNVKLRENSLRIQEIMCTGVEPPVFEDVYEVQAVGGKKAPVLFEFVWVPSGTFQQGSPKTEPNRNSDEDPQHVVLCDEGVFMSKYPITQEQYEAITGVNPAYFKDHPINPVEQVSHDDCKAFCEAATKKDIEQAKKEGRDWYRHYRLPTETEWEYSCRAATTTIYSVGDKITVDDINYSDSGINSTVPVMEYRPNAFGLYDMHGNVWVWCEDGYDSEYYRKRTEKHHKEVMEGKHKVGHMMGKVFG